MAAMDEHRLLIVKPGDTLVIGHSPALTAEQVGRFKDALGLAGVIGLPGEIDLATIRVESPDDGEQPA